MVLRPAHPGPSPCFNWHSAAQTLADIDAFEVVSSKVAIEFYRG